MPSLDKTHKLFDAKVPNKIREELSTSLATNGKVRTNIISSCSFSIFERVISEYCNKWGVTYVDLNLYATHEIKTETGRRRR